MLSAVAAAIRLLGGLASWWLALRAERARGDIAAGLLRTAGPGSSVLDRGRDGSLLLVQAGPVQAGPVQAGPVQAGRGAAPARRRDVR